MFEVKFSTIMSLADILSIFIFPFYDMHIVAMLLHSYWLHVPL
jgi:hypothetical protein